MTTVIILCYQFPPKHNTAAQRPHAWAKYFSEFGFHPVIVTKDFAGNLEEEISHEVTETYEIYRIKMKDTLQAEYWNLVKTNRKLRRHWISFLDKIFQSSIHFGPYKKSIDVTAEIIRKTPGKKILLTTGMPFTAFNAASRIKKITGINWVADYRDDWTTTDLPIRSPIRKFFNRFVDPRNEKKWLSTASGFTSVSSYYVDKIGDFLASDIPGACVENGFFEEEHVINYSATKNDHLSFVYVGSMYDTQDIRPIITALAKVSNDLNYKDKIEFTFLGTTINASRKSALENIVAGSVVQLRFTERLPKEEALSIQGSCHVAVMVPHPGVKGMPSSKLYEFVGAEMPVLAYPSDQDIIHETLSNTRLGILPSDEADLHATLGNLMGKFRQNLDLELTADPSAVSYYSRRASTGRMAEFLRGLAE